MNRIKFLQFIAILFFLHIDAFSQHEVSTNLSFNKDLFVVSTDTLFACIDIFNYFTDRKFDSYFTKMKELWHANKFEEFDKLCDSLGSNPNFLAALKKKKQDGKSRFIVKMPLDVKRVSFNPQTLPQRRERPPETEEIIVSCDCPPPCVVCFCPSSCNVPYYICLCFYDANPGGIPGGGGGGFFCNYFRAGKPCAIRPPDYKPKK